MEKKREAREGAAGTLYISHNFDVCRGSLTQQQALDQTDLMPPKRKAPKAAAAIDLTEMASPQEKKQKVALTAIAKEFVCPITQELPIKPVTAEDGKIYEEKAIREWFSKKDGAPTSPSTGAVIGTKLFPAPQARNTIEALVKSGAIDGEIAEAWQKKLEQESEVAVTRARRRERRRREIYVSARQVVREWRVRPRERRCPSPRVVRAQRCGPRPNGDGKIW